MKERGMIDMGQKIEVKTDCFAYDRMKNGCKDLRALYCANEKCRFYKSKQQYQKELEEDKKRHGFSKK